MRCPVTPPSTFVSLVTNELTTFSMLFSLYPILQSILTYYSLIGAVYLYRMICVIPVRIFRQPPLSPYCLHVFPILRNCLAPPHVPESHTERCNSPVIFIVHTCWWFVASSSFVRVSVYSCILKTIGS